MLCGKGLLFDSLEPVCGKGLLFALLCGKGLLLDSLEPVCGKGLLFDSLDHSCMCVVALVVRPRIPICSMRSCF